MANFYDIKAYNNQIPNDRGRGKSSAERDALSEEFYNQFVKNNGSPIDLGQYDVETLKKLYQKAVESDNAKAKQAILKAYNDVKDFLDYKERKRSNIDKDIPFEISDETNGAREGATSQILKWARQRRNEKSQAKSKPSSKSNDKSMFSNAPLFEEKPKDEVADGGELPTATVKPKAKQVAKAKVERPKVIDIDALVANHTPMLEEKPTSIGETSEELDNNIASAVKPTAEEPQEDERTLIARIWNGLKKSKEDNADVAPKAEVELEAQAPATDNTPKEEATTEKAVDTPVNANYANDKALNELFQNIGANDETKQQILGYLDNYYKTNNNA